MSRSVWFRIAVLLLLLIPLASPARAAGKASPKHRDRSLVAWIQDAVAEIQKTMADAQAQQAKDGDSRGTMDPDGRS